MRILVAEDDALSLKILSLILKSDRIHDVVTARDGEEAWAELGKGTSFDLCIFDVIMPGLDGMELTERIRKDPRLKGQRIMLCTALSDKSTVTHAMELGVSHYIIKPYNREVVLKQVRRIGQECSAPGDSLEDASVVAGRLGVDAAVVQELRLDLLGQLAQLAKNTEGQDATDQRLKINALKGASLNLGVRAMAALLTQLEHELNGGPGSMPPEIRSKIATENSRIGEWLQRTKSAA